MAKTPVAGRVKRRLAGEIGTTAAVNFCRTCLDRTLLRLASDRRWRSYIAVAPDGDLHAPVWTRFSPPRAVRLAQGRGDLGNRMQRLFAAMPPGPVIVVGSDIPAVCARHIAEGFRLLGSADAVFGPAGDGGFWLVGLRRRPRLLSPFAAIRWSTGNALADALANLSGRKVAFAATLDDVDNAGDYRRQRPHWQRLIPPRSSVRPRRACASGA